MLARLLGFLLERPWRAWRGKRARQLLAAARAHERAGRELAARRAFERAIELSPRDGELHRALATLLARGGKPREAAECLERALALDPGDAALTAELGELSLRLGDSAKACACFAAILARSFGTAQAHFNLGRALRQAGDRDGAIVHLRRAYGAAPRAPGFLRQFVLALIDADLCDAARVVAEQALADDPLSAEASLLLGLAWQKLHEPDRALERYQAVQEGGGATAELHDLRGATLLELGRLPEAVAEYQRSLTLDSRHELARFHLAQARLLEGDFALGWDGYELRAGAADAGGASSGIVRWDGSPLAGQTIVVRREQGLGDEIMFASIVPDVVRAAGHCVLECDARLRELFRRSFPQATVFAAIPDGSLPHRVAELRPQLQVAAGSLGAHFRRSAEAFPRHDGYLRADPGRVAHWRERLAALGAGAKIGLAWTGGVRQTRRALRSISPQDLLPLLRTPGACFVSLQYTPEAREDIEGLRATRGVQVTHWQEAIDVFNETAALVSALDLVISVCTTVVHLAGGLGRPAWVMAPVAPEWRYGIAGEAMPWYPSVRIFRQVSYRQWDSVIAAVAAELRDLPGRVSG